MFIHSSFNQSTYTSTYYVPGTKRRLAHILKILSLTCGPLGRYAWANGPRLYCPSPVVWLTGMPAVAKYWEEYLHNSAELWKWKKQTANGSALCTFLHNTDIILVISGDELMKTSISLPLSHPLYTNSTLTPSLFLGGRGRKRGGFVFCLPLYT